MIVFNFLQPDKRTLKKAKTSSDETSSETQDEGGDTNILNSSGSTCSSEENSVEPGSDNESMETEQGMYTQDNYATDHSVQIFYTQIR